MSSVELLLFIPDTPLMLHTPTAGDQEQKYAEAKAQVVKTTQGSDMPDSHSLSMRSKAQLSVSKAF